MSTVGKSARYRTRSEEGQLLIKTSPLQCIFATPGPQCCFEKSKLMSTGNPPNLRVLDAVQQRGPGEDESQQILLVV